MANKNRSIDIYNESKQLRAMVFTPWFIARCRFTEVFSTLKNAMFSACCLLGFGLRAVRSLRVNAGAQAFVEAVPHSNFPRTGRGCSLLFSISTSQLGYT